MRVHLDAHDPRLPIGESTSSTVVPEPRLRNHQPTITPHRVSTQGPNIPVRSSGQSTKRRTSELQSNPATGSGKRTCFENPGAMGQVIKLSSPLTPAERLTKARENNSHSSAVPVRHHQPIRGIGVEPSAYPKGSTGMSTTSRFPPPKPPLLDVGQSSLEQHGVFNPIHSESQAFESFRRGLSQSEPFGHQEVSLSRLQLLANFHLIIFGLTRNRTTL